MPIAPIGTFAGLSTTVRLGVSGSESAVSVFVSKMARYPSGIRRTWRNSIVAAVLLITVLGILGVCEASEGVSEAGGETGGTDSEKGTERGSETRQNSAPLPDDATLLKLRVRELKDMLSKKGAEAECKACTTKQEFVDRIRETFTWADVSESPSASAEESVPSMEELRKMFAQNQDNEYMRKLKEQLKQAGINADVVGNGNNFGNVNIDDLKKAYKDIKPDAQNDGSSESTSADGASTTGSGDDERTEL